MLKKRFAAGAAALLLSAALVCPVGASVVKAATPGTSVSSAASSSGASSRMPDKRKPHRCAVGGDRAAFVLLADLSGKSVKDLKTNYPQQTAWQIARQTGKLEELKKNYLENQRQKIRTMQAEERLAQADGTRLYEELARRVAKIDGVKIVIVGHVRV